MSTSDAFQAVRALARELPFDFADVEAAGRTFVECRMQSVPLACRMAQVWAYCYVVRYFTTRFTYDTLRSPVDCDRLVAECFERVLSGMDGLHDDGRFPAWVSVVCKNTFRSYLRTHVPRHAPLPEELAEDEEPETPDPMLARMAVERALSQLPDYLRDVARRRLVDGESYEQLADAFDKPVSVLRSYVNKACERLRQDAGLRLAAGRD